MRLYVIRHGLTKCNIEKSIMEDMMKILLKKEEIKQ